MKATSSQLTSLKATSTKEHARLRDTEKALVKARAVMNRKIEALRGKVHSAKSLLIERQKELAAAKAGLAVARAKRAALDRSRKRHEKNLSALKAARMQLVQDLVAARAVLAKQTRVTNGWSKNVLTFHAEDKEYARHIAKQAKDRSAKEAARAKEKAKAEALIARLKKLISENVAKEATLKLKLSFIKGKTASTKATAKILEAKIASRQKTVKKTKKKITNTNNKITVEKSFLKAPLLKNSKP